MQKHQGSRAQRAEVEQVVREVLAELLGRVKSTSSAAASAELMVTEKVVSAKEIERRLQGVTRVVVVRGAVITPAARDLLRERKIAIATAVGG